MHVVSKCTWLRLCCCALPVQFLHGIGDARQCTTTLKTCVSLDAPSRIISVSDADESLLLVVWQGRSLCNAFETLWVAFVCDVAMSSEILSAIPPSLPRPARSILSAKNNHPGEIPVMILNIVVVISKRLHFSCLLRA